MNAFVFIRFWSEKFITNIFIPSSRVILGFFFWSIKLLTSIFIILLGSAFWWRENKSTSSGSTCLAIENYFLIKDSPKADVLSEYPIFREKNKIRFCSKRNVNRNDITISRNQCYTLFYLEPDSVDKNKMRLIRLDGYGMRDKYFNKYICELVDKIKTAE